MKTEKEITTEEREREIHDNNKSLSLWFDFHIFGFDIIVENLYTLLLRVEEVGVANNLDVCLRFVGEIQVSSLGYEEEREQ